MLTVQGIYDKGMVQIKESIPDFKKCEVFVTFLPTLCDINDRKEIISEDERKEAFDFLMNSPKISLPKDFDYKEEYRMALRKKYESVN